ncbi:MAG: hypothetical protein JO319_19725, partial [Acidobacteriaceae bacterium]|nr:hypothetical protein [Acidobacteriaceae bacterium]
FPGEYNVEVSVKGQTQKTSTVIHPDPNLHLTPQAIRAQTSAALTLRNQATALNEMIERINGMRRQIADFRKQIATDTALQEKYAALLHEADALDGKLKSAEAAVLNPSIQQSVEEDDIHALTDLHTNIESLASVMAQFEDFPPSAAFLAEMHKYGKQVEEQLTAFNHLLESEVATYNKAAYSAGAPTLFAGGAISVSP